MKYELLVCLYCMLTLNFGARHSMHMRTDIVFAFIFYRGLCRHNRCLTVRPSVRMSHDDILSNG